ncbi:MAG: hypothetical protein KGI41_01415 [Patescibacteria group bacterium]|nr:hypothetical protein [Patescibacteria group bacterium]MDE1965886.1 hypothetical protein [Patescibacteria group bacterium]
MNTGAPETPTRQVAVKSLAVVGFIALIAAGMMLAVSTARYVPAAFSRLGAAAVSLSSVFTSGTPASLVVVPGTGTTTIPFGGTATSTAPATTTAPVTPKPKPKPVVPTAGPGQSSTYQISGATTTPPALHGLSDFATTITAVGYLTSSSTDSFVASTTVPHGASAAVKFTVTNIGTNATGAWKFQANIPTETSYNWVSPIQASLNPGDHIDYVLGFSQAKAGVNQTISIVANYDNAVIETSTNNDSDSRTVTILGS